MPIPAIPPMTFASPTAGIGGLTAAAAPTQAPAAGFGEAMTRGLQQVSAMEQGADAVATDIAAGGPSQVHDLMIATTQASLGVDLLVQVRNRAVEAYQEVMRLQV